MHISLLQLNSNADSFWDKLIPFLTTHDFDVILLQEVAGKDTICGNINSKRDCFKQLQNILSTRYYGELAISQRFTSSPTSYLGNAIFYKKKFLLVKKHALPLHVYHGLFPSNAKSFEEQGRLLLHIKLTINEKHLSFLTTHFAWGKTPIEEPHHTKQGDILLKYLQAISPPFIFASDMNLTPDQPLIQKLNTFARNLTDENNITNTLNPRTHYVPSLFPKGLAVDYIFVSKDIYVEKFEVLEEDISDHFGLIAKIEI